MLEIQDLRISVGARELVAIEHLEIAAGERLGIVGESGSGKTLSVMSILSLLPPEMEVRGSIRYLGRELLGESEKNLRDIRGREIGMVFQDASRSLNPTMKVGHQLTETLRLHTSFPRSEVTRRVLSLMERVKLPDPKLMLSRYPHELSGGQQQRVMIAMAIACGPRILIADEPTTALDVTVQQGVLELLLELSEEQQMALIFVSHNLGVVQALCQRIAVMHNGTPVEIGPTAQILSSPHEEYTRSLLAANPVLPSGRDGTEKAGDPVHAISEET